MKDAKKSLIIHGVMNVVIHIPVLIATYFKLCYEDKHLISIYDTRRAEKEHIDNNIKYHIEFF